MQQAIEENPGNAELVLEVQLAAHIYNSMLGDIAAFRQRNAEKIDVAVAVLNEGMTLVAARLKAGFNEFTATVRAVLCAAPLQISASGNPTSLGRGELSRLEQVGAHGSSGSGFGGQAHSVQSGATSGPLLLPPLAQPPWLQAGPLSPPVPPVGAAPAFDMAIFARAVAQEIARSSVMPPPTGHPQAQGSQASPK